VVIGDPAGREPFTSRARGWPSPDDRMQQQDWRPAASVVGNLLRHLLPITI
jgi:hypothetical protein